MACQVSRRRRRDPVLLVTSALCLALVLIKSNAALRCVDESDQAVDWVVVYKLPRAGNHEAHTPDDWIAQGLGYAFITSQTTSLRSWTLSNLSVGDPLSIPGRILAPLYQANLSALQLFYNDEHPDGSTSSTLGHTKGVAAFHPDSGFWLIHSVPKFPPPPDAGRYSYPSTGQAYGQSMLCLSMDTEANVDLIGLQLIYNHPFIYVADVPAWAKGRFSHFEAAARGQYIRQPPFYHTTVLRSLANEAFVSLAKYTAFDKDLYADLVAPVLKTNLLVESWPNGPGKMASTCDRQFQVRNVVEVELVQQACPGGCGNATRLGFSHTHDHSKWAVSDSGSGHWVCIGDINRMESQRRRAGGTVCLQQQPHLWSSFVSIIKAVEPCPLQRP